MPLVVGGPPEWVWERKPHPLRCEISESRSLEGHTVFEVTVRCGLEIMRLHFLTREELQAFHRLLSEHCLDSQSECAAGKASENAIDEAVNESFPASDAPARTPIAGVGTTLGRGVAPASQGDAHPPARAMHRTFEFDGREFIITVSPFDTGHTKWDVSIHETTKGTCSSDDSFRIEARSQDEAFSTAEDRYRVQLSNQRTMSASSR